MLASTQIQPVCFTHHNSLDLANELTQIYIFSCPIPVSQQIRKSTGSCSTRRVNSPEYAGQNAINVLPQGHTERLPLGARLPIVVMKLLVLAFLKQAWSVPPAEQEGLVAKLPPKLARGPAGRDDFGPRMGGTLLGWVWKFCGRRGKGVDAPA